MSRHALILLTLLALPGLAQAQVYRCVDKNGRTTFSQTKPADKDCQGQDSTGPGPSGADGGSLQEYSQQLDKSRGEEAKARQKSDQQQANHDARCSDAKARQHLYNQP